MKKTFIALSIAALSSISSVAHAGGEYESAMRVQQVCMSVGKSASLLYQAKQLGADRTTLYQATFDQPGADSAPDTDWAKDVLKAYHDMFDYSWDKASSADDAANISYAKCLDDLRIYQ